MSLQKIGVRRVHSVAAIAVGIAMMFVPLLVGTLGGAKSQSVMAQTVPTEVASITGRVFFDPERDGVQGPNDVGIVGATIIFTPNRSAVLTTTSAPDGTYVFENFPAGPGTISVALPSGTSLVPTPTGIGRPNWYSDASPGWDSDGDSKYFGNPPGQTTVFDSGWADPNTTLPSTIVGRVFEDRESSGVFEQNYGLGSTRVELVDERGAVLQSAVTYPDGVYVLTTLRSIPLQVRSYRPAGSSYVPSVIHRGKNADMSTSGYQTSSPEAAISGMFADSVGTRRINLNFGWEAPSPSGRAAVGGWVWTENLYSPIDNVQSGNDAGLLGSRVDLLSPNGDVIATQVTGRSDASYLFRDLEPGTYRVRVQKREDSRLVVPNAGRFDIDSDAQRETEQYAETNDLVLLADRPERFTDFGFYEIRGPGDIRVSLKVAGQIPTPIPTFPINANCNNGGIKATISLGDNERWVYRDNLKGTSCHAVVLDSKGGEVSFIDNRGLVTDGRVYIRPRPDDCALVDDADSHCFADIAITVTYPSVSTSSTPSVPSSSSSVPPTSIDSTTTLPPASTSTSVASRTSINPGSTSVTTSTPLDTSTTSTPVDTSTTSAPVDTSTTTSEAPSTTSTMTSTTTESTSTTSTSISVTSTSAPSSTTTTSPPTTTSPTTTIVATSTTQPILIVLTPPSSSLVEVASTTAVPSSATTPTIALSPVLLPITPTATTQVRVNISPEVIEQAPSGVTPSDGFELSVTGKNDPRRVIQGLGFLLTGLGLVGLNYRRPNRHA